MATPLALTAIVTVAYQGLFFLITALFKFDKLTDFAGSTNFVVLAILTLVVNGSWHIRQVVLSLLVIIWGLRLGLFLPMRILHWGEDRHFDKIRANLGKLAVFWILQAVWVWTVSLPVTVVNSSNKESSIQAADIIGWFMWSVGFLVEATADQQKLALKNSPQNKEKWCNVGLWKYTHLQTFFIIDQVFIYGPLQIRNEKARRYLTSMRKKQPVPFTHKFPNADPNALRLLEQLLAFDPKDRPTAEEALANPYFTGLANIDREPLTQPISKLEFEFEFEFERRKLTKDDVRELIYREILEYHPQMLQEYLQGGDQTSSFMYPSGVDRFKRQFAHLEEKYGKGEKGTHTLQRQMSPCRERVPAPKEYTDQSNESENAASHHSPPSDGSDNPNANGPSKTAYTPVSSRSLLKSASISGSKCIGEAKKNVQEDLIAEVNDESVEKAEARISNLQM